MQQILNQLGCFLHLPPAPPQERQVELEHIFIQLGGFQHLPPPPPPQVPEQIPQEPVEEQAMQVELFEEPVEVRGEETIELESSSEYNEILVVAEIAAPESRRKARRVGDDDEYVVENVFTSRRTIFDQVDWLRR
jgi:hypothetical protein